MKVKRLNLNLGASCRSCPPTLDPPAPLLPARILSPPDHRPHLRAAVLVRATVDVLGCQLLRSSTPGPPSTSRAATSLGTQRPATTHGYDEPMPSSVVHCCSQAGARRRPPCRSSRELGVRCPGPRPCPT
jgi:hypothetical protein